MRTLITIKTSHSNIISFNTFPCLHFIRITLEIYLWCWYIFLFSTVGWYIIFKLHTSAHEIYILHVDKTGLGAWFKYCHSIGLLIDFYSRSHHELQYFSLSCGVTCKDALRTISIMYSHIYTSRPIWTFFVDSNIFPWLITDIATIIPHFNHGRMLAANGWKYL